MPKSKPQQMTIKVKEQLTNFRSLCDDFLMACRAAERAKGTLTFYQFHANLITSWLDGQGIRYLEEITPAVNTQYFLWMTEHGHNKGGKLGAFRTLRAIINHYIRAYDPENFKNSLNRVKPPERSKQVLDPVSFEDVKQLMA